MTHTTATTSPSTQTSHAALPARQLERLSLACTFARAREEGRRGQVVEIVVSLLFGGCVLFSIGQSATASFTLHRSDALDQVVVRAMQKKAAPVVATAATPARPTSGPARTTTVTRPL